MKNILNLFLIFSCILATSCSINAKNSIGMSDSIDMSDSIGMSDSVREEKTYTYENTYGNIIISDIATDVIIKPSKDDKIHLTTFENEDFYYEITDNSILDIKFKSKDKLNFSTDEKNTGEDYRLELRIPINYNNNLSISTVGSDVSVNDITTDNLKIKTVSGDISINDTPTNNFNFSTTSGDIDLNNLDINNLSGDTISGNVSLYLDEEESNYAFSLDTLTGNISVNNNVYKKEYTSSTSEKNIIISTLSSDINITTK